MATLTMQPIGATPTAQEDPKELHKAADPSGIDSEWVVLQKSDVCPADLGAADAGAGAGGGGHLRFWPLPLVPVWAKLMIGGVVYMVVPFYKRVRRIEVEAVEDAETAVEVVEHAAEVTEKLAAEAANKLPEKGCLEQAAVKVEYFAEEVDKDAQKVEIIVKKIGEIGDEVDAAVEPIIENLEKEFKAPIGRTNAQK